MSFVCFAESVLLFCFFSTQLPQAAGVGYSLKMEKKNACAVTFIGDGGTSEVSKSQLSIKINISRSEIYLVFLGSGFEE